MRETIISDATCFIILSKIGELELLRKTYGSIVTTSVVAAEYGDLLPAWVTIRNPVTISQQDSIAILGQGKASAISLALEITTSTLILDDYQARRVAERLVTGTLGVFVRAKLNGLIPSIRPLIEKMRQTNFRLSAKVETEALVQAGDLVQ